MRTKPPVNKELELISEEIVDRNSGVILKEKKSLVKLVVY